MRPSLNRIVLYAKDVQATCAFYERHFEYECEVARQPSSPVDLHCDQFTGRRTSAHNFMKCMSIALI